MPQEGSSLGHLESPVPAVETVFLGLAGIVQETAGDQHRQVRLRVVAGEGPGAFGDFDRMPEIAVTADIPELRLHYVGVCLSASLEIGELTRMLADMAQRALL